MEKVSEITVEELADYLRLYEITDSDKRFLGKLLDIAKTYVASYTGHTLDELDSYPDFTIVVMVLVQDMYDNRALISDGNGLHAAVNTVVETILGMHAVNLL